MKITNDNVRSLMGGLNENHKIGLVYQDNNLLQKFDDGFSTLARGKNDSYVYLCGIERGISIQRKNTTRNFQTEILDKALENFHELKSDNPEMEIGDMTRQIADSHTPIYYQDCLELVSSDSDLYNADTEDIGIENPTVFSLAQTVIYYAIMNYCYENKDKNS